MQNNHRQNPGQQPFLHKNIHASKQIQQDNPELENKRKISALKKNPISNTNPQQKQYKTIQVLQPKKYRDYQGQIIGYSRGRKMRSRVSKKFNAHQGLSTDRSPKFRKQSAQIDLPGLDLSNYKNRQIASIYLSKCPLHKNNCFTSRNCAKLPRHKKITADCPIQTQHQLQNSQQPKNTHHTKLQPLKKRKIKIGPIQQNDSDQQTMPINRKHLHNTNNINNINGINNSIPVTQSLNTNNKNNNVDRYLSNINRNQYNFLTTVKRYNTKSQYPQQNTKYSQIDGNDKKSNVMDTISQYQKYNPWENVDQKCATNKQPQIYQNHQKKFTKNNYKDQEKSTIYPNQYNAENNKSKTIKNNQYCEKCGVYYNNNNHDQNKSVSDYKQASIISKQVQNSVQTQQIKGVQIGTDTNPNDIRPIHPINNQQNQDYDKWIKQHYKPKSDFLTNINTKNWIIKKYKNCVFFGQFNNQTGHKHGIGVIFYFNGKSYEGNFINDVKQGKGYQYLPNGSTYQGDFHRGFKQGKGVYQWSNGQIYVGQWLGGKKSGSGTWKSPRGDSYIGQWKNNYIQGFGVLSVKQGDRYQGQFKKSMKHGLGTQRYSNGDTFVGEFYKNKPNGQGQYYSQNGDYYKGTFSNGLKHGTGTQKKVDQSVYHGQFRNDKRCGYAEQTDNQGNKYVGNYENNLKHGFGQQKNKDNEVKKGYWINGEFIAQQKSGKEDKAVFKQLMAKKQRQKQRDRQRNRYKYNYQNHNNGKNDGKNDGKNGVRNDLKNDLKNDSKNDLKNDSKNDAKNDLKSDARSDVKSGIKGDIKQKKQKKQSSRSPTFNKFDQDDQFDPNLYRPCGCLKRR